MFIKIKEGTMYHCNGRMFSGFLTEARCWAYNPTVTAYVGSLKGRGRGANINLESTLKSCSCHCSYFLITRCIGIVIFPNFKVEVSTSAAQHKGSVAATNDAATAERKHKQTWAKWNAVNLHFSCFCFMGLIWNVAHHTLASIIFLFEIWGPRELTAQPWRIRSFWNMK